MGRIPVVTIDSLRGTNHILKGPEDPDLTKFADLK